MKKAIITNSEQDFENVLKEKGYEREECFNIRAVNDFVPLSGQKIAVFWDTDAHLRKDYYAIKERVELLKSINKAVEIA